MVYPLAAFFRGVERPFLFLEGGCPFQCGRLVSRRPQSRNPDFLRVRELAWMKLRGV